MTTIWHNYPNSILLTKDDGTQVIIKTGDFIKFKTRELGVKITNIVGKETSGPIGLEYLPWKNDKWGDPVITLRGNAYFIICYPTGIPHYGQHIMWNTVEHLPYPIQSHECASSS